MGGVTRFLFVYFLGGLTFIPLLLAAVFLHAYLTFPVREDNDTTYRDRDGEADPIVRPGDDVDAIKHAQDTLGEKFQPRNNEADVAAGYFACVREYTPGGVNGKPPERNTPVGSTSISSSSPSVYQSMYRSIFDRKQNPGPLENKGVGKPQRKGGNVFYVVLRHGHLMLFDDEEQLEVRHVVSLAHHNVSIYSGGDQTPEGELFIKRNALCLSRKTDVGELTPDGMPSKPFFLFSENCSAKEDFYLALLRNQERKANARDNPPVPLRYDVKNIITLVQRLHSSEEHLQTRWINALVGRLFLGLYKTPDVENFVRRMITKKISRVKKPSFLSKIVLKDVDMGEAAPVITNPRLKDLTVDGELVVEADMRYSGNFRLVVAATARIDLGARFKAREVELLLAVVVKRVEGHAMIRIKPPPSNRIWLTFATNPKIEMTIEPIVNLRQITYTMILRQIENRIKEVVAESLVFPNWDDFPFYRTENKLWRGGIWADQNVPKPQDRESLAAQEGNVDQVEALEVDNDPTNDLPSLEQSMSLPLIDPSPPSSVYSRKSAKSTTNLGSSKPDGSSTSVDTRSLDKPRALRSGSFATVSQPVVSTDITNAEIQAEHHHAMDAISALSQSNSPAHTPVGSSSRPPSMEQSGSQSSASSRDATSMERGTENELTPQPSLSISDTAIGSNKPPSCPPSPSSISNASFKSEAPSAKSSGSFGVIGNDVRRENSTSSSKSSAIEAKRISLAAVTNAAATAKKWGWNALQRHADQKANGQPEVKETLRPIVMGRGQPLPPPGTPLPPPDRKTKTAPIPVPKRKPIPPPASGTLSQKHQDTANEASVSQSQKHEVAPPPLPKRRNREASVAGITDTTDDSLFVVAAPAVDSEPTTPQSEHTPVYLQPWVDDAEDSDEKHEAGTAQSHQPPRLPKRRPPGRVLSSSPEEDSHKLPSWLAAQEEEARVKSTYVDEDMGV